jgi:GH24 family phage-related lysozyme (muramidase)
MTITKEQALAYLSQDIQRFENAVNRLVTVPLTQNQFDALVSFTFNAGEGKVDGKGGLANSALLQKLNNGDYDAVPAEMARWKYEGGQVRQGLILRRFDEGEVWSKGEYTRTPKCFVAGTMIQMADGSEKPIEDIRPGDMVMAFDPHDQGGLGPLKPRKVTRTFQNTAQTIINLRGLQMTPGHVVLSDNGDWLKIADVLNQDRAIVEQKGDEPILVRARTGAPVGSIDDIPIHVIFEDPETNRHRVARVRAGIPALVHKTGLTAKVATMADVLLMQDYTIEPDGTIIGREGRRYNATPWPERGTPYDFEPNESWILSVDGEVFTPRWIADLPAADDETGRPVGMLS